MKFLTTNRFFRVLKRLLLLLPLSFVAVTSLYVVFNPNAKDSFYGETINDSDEVHIYYDNLVVGQYYTFDNVISNDKTSLYGNANYLVIDNVVNVNGFNNNVDLSNVARIRLYLTDSYNALNFLDINGNSITSFNLFDFVGIFTFRYQGLVGDINVLSYYNYFYQTVYHEYSYLNNAFEYGMYQFNQIGFGRLDLVSWFSGMFAINNNNVYIQFLNSYFNYFLLVECVAILPMFIHWIIHLFEDAVDYFRFNKNRKGDEND